MGSECIGGVCWPWYGLMIAGVIIMIFKVIIPLIKMKKQNKTNGK